MALSTTAKTFGNFWEDTSNIPEFLIIGFSPSAISLKQRWRNNGLSASFIADYLVAFFPVNETEFLMVDKRNKLLGAVRYVANELLENAMKFNHEVSQQPVSIKLELMPDRVVFRAFNAIDPATVDRFQAIIKELTMDDPNELLIRQVEKNTLEGWDSSGLGLLTIMNDYDAKLGWKFDTPAQAPGVVTVTTTVQLLL